MEIGQAKLSKLLTIVDLGIGTTRENVQSGEKTEVNIGQVNLGQILKILKYRLSLSRSNMVLRQLNIKC